MFLHEMLAHLGVAVGLGMAVGHRAGFPLEGFAETDGVAGWVLVGGLQLIEPWIQLSPVHLAHMRPKGAAGQGFAAGGAQNPLSLVFSEAGAFTCGSALAGAFGLVYD